MADNLDYIATLMAKNPNTWTQQEGYNISVHIKALEMRAAIPTAPPLPAVRRPDKLILEKFSGTTPKEMFQFIKNTDARIAAAGLTDQEAALPVILCLAGEPKLILDECIKFGAEHCSTWSKIKKELLKNHKKGMHLIKIFSTFEYKPRNANDAQLILSTVFNTMTEELSKISSSKCNIRPIDVDAAELATLLTHPDPITKYRNNLQLVREEVELAQVRQHILEQLPEMISSVAKKEFKNNLRGKHFTDGLVDISNTFEQRLYVKSDTEVPMTINAFGCHEGEDMHLDRIYSGKQQGKNNGYNNKSKGKKDGNNSNREPQQQHKGNYRGNNNQQNGNSNYRSKNQNYNNSNNSKNNYKNDGNNKQKPSTYITTPVFCFQCCTWCMHWARECNASQKEIDGLRQLNHQKDKPKTIENIIDTQYPERVVKQKKEMGKIVYDINEEYPSGDEYEYTDDSKN